MYQNFFGLNEQAFSIAVNPRYLYMSEHHREALAHLVYGIRVGGFVLLTGEVGTGKTTIIRCLLEQLPDATDIAIVMNPMASAPELLTIICDELGVTYNAATATTNDLVNGLHQYLLRRHEQGRKTVLLIDEAQLLAPAVLEQVRLLTNLETTTEKLLQIILVGQPELNELLARPSLRQLSQRITARFHLDALSPEDTRAYIAHRLAVAGFNTQPDPFLPDIVKRIHEFSGGVPRLINILCERLLLGAYGKNQRVVDRAIFQQAVEEVAGKTASGTSPKFPPSNWWMALTGGLIVLLAGTIYLRYLTQSVPEAAIAAPISNTHSILDNNSNDDRALENRVNAALTEPVLLEQPVVTWERDLARAQATLFAYLAVGDATDVCASNGIYACEQVQLTTWDDLKALNRPAVLGLVGADKKLAFAILIGLDETQAKVLIDGQPRDVAWEVLAGLWNGSTFYLWTQPPGFVRPITQGDRGPAVDWLARQFATLDQQPLPLTRDTYNAALKTRVEIFQAQQNLTADGIAGVQTLRKLNDVLGLDKTLAAIETDNEASIGVDSTSAGDSH